MTVNTEKKFETSQSPSAKSQRVYSLCGMCAVRCPIQVDVEGQKAVWVQGNENDSSIGPSLCAKGSAGLCMEYDDDERPQYPLIRTGARGEGQWRRASWDEALEYISNKLNDVINKYGGRGVALSDRGGPFTDLTKSFLKAIGSPNYFNHDCTCGRNAHHATQTLFGLGRTGVVYDIKNTKHIVLIGRNLLESLQVKEAKDFMQALENGAKCTYIDPRATLTASKATRFWKIKPNTEYALNLSIINVILDENLYDNDFVSRWVSGLEDLRSFVQGYTPEWQEQYTHIPASEVRSFVREIASDAPHVIFHAGWMSARHKQSFYTSRTSHIINALLGAIEVPGGVPFSKGPKDAGYKPLNALADQIPRVEEERVDQIGSKYKHWDAGPGLLHLLFPAIEQEDPYPMGAYIAYRHDPLSAMPDPDDVKNALDKLELLVSIDIHYSEMAWFSDVILPESTYLERANILAQKGGLKPSFQMRDQAIPPRFDSRPAWWIFKELAKQLGVGKYFDFESIEDIWSYQLESTGINIDQMRNKGVLSLSSEPIYFDRENGLKFKTPSGKIEIISSVLKEAGLESLQEFRPPSDLQEDEFRLLFGRTAVHAHAQSINNPYLHELKPDNELWIHTDRAKKLGIQNGQTIEVSNNGYKDKGRAFVTSWIHPDAVFMLHGFGRTVPAQTRAYKKGVADQRLQKGMLREYDPAGGGNAMSETTVHIRPVSD